MSNHEHAAHSSTLCWTQQCKTATLKRQPRFQAFIMPASSHLLRQVPPHVVPVRLRLLVTPAACLRAGVRGRRATPQRWPAPADEDRDARLHSWTGDQVGSGDLHCRLHPVINETRVAMRSNVTNNNLRAILLNCSESPDYGNPVYLRIFRQFGNILAVLPTTPPLH
jgi:hypothetical protein